MFSIYSANVIISSITVREYSPFVLVKQDGTTLNIVKITINMRLVSKMFDRQNVSNKI